MSTRIVNQQPGGWAWDGFASDLANLLNCEIREDLGTGNYLLFVEGIRQPADLVGWWTHARSDNSATSFIPVPAIAMAADKRLQHAAFGWRVPTPRTFFVDDLASLKQVISDEGLGTRWLLKDPISLGGQGCLLPDDASDLPHGWSVPFLVQELIATNEPAVYRMYGAEGECFGWNVRRFGDVGGGPIVSRHLGAEYTLLGAPPAAAERAARAALSVTGLLDSFGSVDLVPSGDDWMVLEVGTDGPFEHVDRSVPAPLKREMDERLRSSFERYEMSSAVLDRRGLVLS